VTDIVVGETVYSTRQIAEGPSDHSPGGVLCFAGELLEVVEVRPKGEFRFAVRHPGRTGSFLAKASEISRMKPFDHNLPYSQRKHRGSDFPA
jgi:hypothetical protein